MDDNVGPSLTKHDNTPHFLMELSIHEYTTLKNNCIHVSDVTFHKSTDTSPQTTRTTFARVDNGKNINFITDETSNILQLDRCKSKIVLITIDKFECHKAYQDVQILNTQLRSSCSGSGIVVLMMTIKATKIGKDIEDKRILWARLIIEMCHYCKPNILDSNMVTHHSSRGKIYSFGYQGVFKLIENSSVGLYSVRKRYVDERQVDVENTAATIEKMIGIEMAFATQSLSKIVRQIDRFIMPLLDTANRLQCSNGNILLKKKENECAAMWNTNICVNASTGEFHTENDTSYTLITVPQQDFKSQKNCGNTYNFLFKLNEGNQISLPLIPNVSCLFSGLFLYHRQKGNDSKEQLHKPFVNLSSYGNQRLFTHIRKSFTRNNTN